jgi:hypothetical protein
MRRGSRLARDGYWASVAVQPQLCRAAAVTRRHGDSETLTRNPRRPGRRDFDCRAAPCARPPGADRPCVTSDAGNDRVPESIGPGLLHRACAPVCPRAAAGRLWDYNQCGLRPVAGGGAAAAWELAGPDKLLLRGPSAARPASQRPASVLRERSRSGDSVGRRPAANIRDPTRNSTPEPPGPASGQIHTTARPPSQPDACTRARWPEALE